MKTLRTLLETAVLTDRLPAELSGCSPLFLAIIGYLVGIATTYPVITDMMVTTDGAILSKHEGDAGFDHAPGIYREALIANLNGLCDALGAPESDREELLNAVPRPFACEAEISA